MHYKLPRVICFHFISSRSTITRGPPSANTPTILSPCLELGMGNIGKISILVMNYVMFGIDILLYCITFDNTSPTMKQLHALLYNNNSQ